MSQSTHTRYIVVTSAGALKFHSGVTANVCEIVPEPEATRFDSMTAATLAALPHWLEGYKIAPVSAHVPTAN